MNLIARLKKRRRSKQRIKDYQKGVFDTNKIRDFQDEVKEKNFKVELDKKNEKIKELQNIILSKDKYVDQVRAGMPILKRQLDEIECFVEYERDENHKEAGKKLLKINETKRQIKKINKIANNITLNMLELTDSSNLE